MIFRFQEITPRKAVKQKTALKTCRSKPRNISGFVEFALESRLSGLRAQDVGKVRNCLITGHLLEIYRCADDEKASSLVSYNSCRSNCKNVYRIWRI